MSMLFEPSDLFEGLPLDGFAVFRIPDHDERRRQIIRAFHPALEVLGDDLRAHLAPPGTPKLYRHQPRLDWPRGYKPFCTWLALSREPHGYLGRAQLNVGVHADYVALRLGWDTHQEQFGRFQFIARHGGLGQELKEIASSHGMAFRVYASAPFPKGSRRVFESPDDWRASLDVTRHAGVWWELGRRLDLADSAELIGSPELGREAARLFEPLLPVCDRL